MKYPGTETLKHFFNHYKKPLLVGIPFVFITLLYLILSLITAEGPSNPDDTVAVATVTPVPIQKPFRVIDANIKNGDVEIFPGEIVIAFTANNPINSPDNLTVTFTPELAHEWKYTNTFPSENIRIQIIGGLKLSTKYTLSVTDKQGETVYGVNFTTSDEIPDSSTQLVRQEEEQLIRDYYPLLLDTPYITSNFSLEYIDRLALSVKIKNSDVEAVKQEVNAWIKSKGVDPLTHTIRYENAF
jgi:hypothetical protein